MNVIAIANQKGGVAKSTTGIDLAAGLTLEGIKTLLIDGDPQESASSVFIRPEEEVELDKNQTLYGVIMNFVPLRGVIRKTRFDNLHFVPSHIRLSSTDLELANALDNRSERLKRALDQLGDEYDYVIIDTGRSLGLLTINALAASNSVIIPVAPQWFSMKGLAQLQETIDMVRQQLNPNLSILGVLPTMIEHTVVSRDVIKQLREHFGNLVFDTVIPKNIKVEEAHSRHTHIFEYAPNSKGAQAYKALVKEVLSR